MKRTKPDAILELRFPNGIPLVRVPAESPARRLQRILEEALAEMEPSRARAIVKEYAPKKPIPPSYTAALSAISPQQARAATKAIKGTKKRKGVKA